MFSPEDGGSSFLLTLVSRCKTTWRHVTEDRSLDSRRCEKIKIP